MTKSSETFGQLAKLDGRRYGVFILLQAVVTMHAVSKA